MATAQAEVGGAAYGHVTDGALEGQTLADGALSPSSRVATVAAEDTKLDASVRFRRTRGELQHVCSFVPQTPAVQDLTVTLLKVIKLQHVGRVQQPLVHVVLLPLSFSGVGVALGTVAVIIRRGLAPRVGVFRVSSCVPGGGCDGVRGAGAGA